MYNANATYMKICSKQIYRYDISKYILFPNLPKL
jgi:hypothetical protein